MMTDILKKRQALPDQAREAALDSAAATLAAIHMGKQVGAEITAAGRASMGEGRDGLPRDLRLPLGDVLFGVAQLQVDFARRLFEFNREASAVLRKRLRGGLAPPAERPIIRATAHHKDKPKLCFSVKNTAALSRTFGFRAAIDDGSESARGPAGLERFSVTIAAGRAREIEVTFDRPVQRGTYAGDLAVLSQGLEVELVPFEITVT
jgi:hypothetical protein